LWDLFFVEDPLNPSRKIKKFSAVGPQGKAYDAWCRINPSETEAETIIAKVKSELDRRVHQHASGEFAPNLPHVVRLIRDRRWEEFEESEVITKEFHF